MTNKKVVLAMSGGMDSTTLCGWYLNQNYTVYPVIFNYGSKHNRYENNAALGICNHWELNYKFVKLDFMKDIVKSNLMMDGGDIPEGHYEDKTMKLTVVPGRNLIFASILASYAESNEINTIALGVHSGDHEIYPDCRPEFIYTVGEVLRTSTEGKIDIETPFLKLDKSQILKLGYNFNKVIVPYELTRTCYKDQYESCGKCGSCTERLEAFKNINKNDPITYDEKG